MNKPSLFGASDRQFVTSDITELPAAHPLRFASIESRATRIATNDQAEGTGRKGVGRSGLVRMDY
jgi:hypothetical protein